MSALDGRVALVTGASRGLGRAAAARIGAAGAHVIAVARTVGGLEELDDEIKAAGGQTTLVPLDLTDGAALPRLGKAIHDRWGKLDLWLHTAAHAAPLQPAEHIAPKELAATLALNITAFVGLIRVLDPLLALCKDGRALIVADDRTGERFFGTYAASKAAQSALARAWGAEAARRLAVAEVVPPAMPTALRARFFPGEDKNRLTATRTVAERLIQRLDHPVAPGEQIVIDAAVPVET